MISSSAAVAAQCTWQCTDCHCTRAVTAAWTFSTFPTSPNPCDQPHWHGTWNCTCTDCSGCSCPRASAARDPPHSRAHIQSTKNVRTVYHSTRAHARVGAVALARADARSSPLLRTICRLAHILFDQSMSAPSCTACATSSGTSASRRYRRCSFFVIQLVLFLFRCAPHRGGDRRRECLVVSCRRRRRRRRLHARQVLRGGRAALAERVRCAR